MLDARLYQILFLGLFLVLGVGTRDWTLRPGTLPIAIATCCLTQAIGDRLTQSPPSSELFPPGFFARLSRWLSPLITALGLTLLLRVDHYSTLILACLAAIGSKFVLRFNDKHLFNPANFGIVAALLLTQDAWVSPGQWGDDRWYALVFLCAGGVVLQKVGRWDTTIAFLGSYALLEGIRNYWLGWTWDVWLHRLGNGSFLLFALFMVTDPRTIPNARMARVIWAVAIALLTFVLRNLFFINTAVFWALFVLAPLTPLLDWIWPADRFHWRSDPSDTHSDPISVDTSQSSTVFSP